MSLRSGLVREVAFSTPERDRDRDHHCDALSLPFELLAPQKRRPRNTTEHGRRYRRPLSQPDPSADDSDTIPIESSQPDLRTKRSTTTNKDLLVALTETIRQQTETIRNLECETKEIRQNQQALIDHNVKLIDEVAELRTRVLGPLWLVRAHLRDRAPLPERQRASSTLTEPISLPSTCPTSQLTCPEQMAKMAECQRARSEQRWKRKRDTEDHRHWRCRAVTVDHATQSRIRIACRDEDEHELVKRAAEKIGAGSRVLRDELFPVKIDNVKRTAVLDERDEIKAGAAEAFGEENGTTVAKIAWLSKRDVPKAYGSETGTTTPQYNGNEKDLFHGTKQRQYIGSQKHRHRYVTS